jgi:heterodisulfide reductase subunit A
VGKTMETREEVDKGQGQILVMEDEASVAEGLEMILKEKGYQVDLARTGKEALKVLDRNEFDLLVADLRLPDMNGMDVIREARKKKNRAEVLVITGYGSVPSAVEAMKAGVIDYLPKPFTEEEFIGRVERALERREEPLVKEGDESLETSEIRADVQATEKAPQVHVLVVEDEPSVGMGLKMILMEKGYGVDLVGTGKEALKEGEQREYDLLVADLRLPDMNGMQVIRKTKKSHPRTQAMVITGYSDVSSAVEAMKTGAADYMAKPFTEEEFLSRVEKVLSEGVEAKDPYDLANAMPLRIGFYVCHGGTDIASKVRISDLINFAQRQLQVVVTREHKYLCQEEGLQMVERDIKKFGLKRVVVGACSPKVFENRFQEVCQRAGLKPEHLQVISLREQVAWVTEDPLEATRKAKILAAAAIHRAKYHRTLTTREVKVRPEVLIVGGGIAGMQAALDIAEAGHKVYLVERQPTIGGHMLQFDKTFPTLDCAACIGTPKMVSVGQNPNIELLTYSEVKEVSGIVGNYKVQILRKPRYVKEGVCTGCGECANVCPVSRPGEWDEGLGNRKAVYRPFPQAMPITFTIDKKDRAPCVMTCPAGVNVQGYVQLIGQGKYSEAVQLIMERLPLPGVLGRVCPHPCEAQCRRREVDEPLAIRDLKRFASDQVNLEALPVPEIQDRPEKVAVIGSGPAGLTAAYYLRRKGYQIRIYEALPVLGGMLRVGIPDYRLPAEILDREIDYILRLGIEVKTGQVLGKDFTLSDLEMEGFKAVFLAMGAHRSIKANIQGEDQFQGVLDAVDFLREANLGKQAAPGQRVVVIGGGNVAVDAARVSKRLGSEEVHILYRRSREEMPAYLEEVEAALDEGIQIAYLTAPVRIQGDQGQVTGLECIKTELGEPDASGRRRPVPVEGSEFVLSCDAVVPAIGQRPDLDWLRKNTRIGFSRWDTIEVNPYTMQTDVPHIFAAGDAVTGPATVIEAVAAGHKAVEAIDRLLKGEDLTLYAEGRKAQPAPGNDWAALPRKPETQPRARPGHRKKEERLASFVEMDLGLSEEEARQEALRCLNCGVCSECMECVKVCEAKAIDHCMKPEEIEIEVGSIIVATGYHLMDPSPMTQFGYARYPNVLTSLEFERLNNATGPTAGQILMRGENGGFSKPPGSVAIIHCVGSRDQNYHEYCSRVCCMYALKYGHLLKDKLGHQTRVYDFYIDMRCFGKGYEEFYCRCQEEGILFFRGKPSEVTDQALSPQEKGKLIVIGEDTLLNRTYRIPVDMVILCAAMEAQEDSGEVAKLFGIRRGLDGFFSEEHAKLAPMSTGSAGIFLAGSCQAPKDIPDTVAQASGAAAKALDLAILGKVEIPATIAWIDPEICEGCRACIKACPYGAIDFDAQGDVSTVKQAICRGCGICVAACSNGAAHMWQFGEDRILTEMDGIEERLRAVGI